MDETEWVEALIYRKHELITKRKWGELADYLDMVSKTYQEEPWFRAAVSNNDLLRSSIRSGYVIAALSVKGASAADQIFQRAIQAYPEIEELVGERIDYIQGLRSGG